jgi:hypothetical protein
VTQAKEQAKKLWEQIRKESYAPKAFSVLLSLCERLEALEEANERQYQMGREQLLRLEAAEKALKRIILRSYDDMAVDVPDELLASALARLGDMQEIAQEAFLAEHPPKGGQEEEKENPQRLLQCPHCKHQWESVFPPEAFEYCPMQRCSFSFGKPEYVL